MTNADVILLVLLMVVACGFFVIVDQLAEISKIVRGARSNEKENSD